jgi:hypothetical protein
MPKSTVAASAPPTSTPPARPEAAIAAANAILRNELLLGEIADKLTAHAGYGARALAKLARAVGMTPTLLGRYRTRYRRYRAYSALADQ